MKPYIYYSTEISKMGFLAQFRDPKIRLIVLTLIAVGLTYRLPLPTSQLFNKLNIPDTTLSALLFKATIAMIIASILTIVSEIKTHGIPFYKPLRNEIMKHTWKPWKYYSNTEIKELKESQFRFVQSSREGCYDICTKYRLIRLYKITSYEYTTLSEVERNKLDNYSVNFFNNLQTEEVNQMLTVKRLATKNDFIDNVNHKIDCMRPLFSQRKQQIEKVKDINLLNEKQEEFKTLSNLFNAYQDNVKNFDVANRKTPKIDNYFITSEKLEVTGWLNKLKRFKTKSMPLESIKRASNGLDAKEKTTIQNLQKQGHKVERLSPDDLVDTMKNLIILD